MPPIDLASTYIQLHDGGAAQPVPVDAQFWSHIGERPELQEGRLIMQFEFEDSWRYAEMHPEGDEIVFVLSGALELILEYPEGAQRVSLQAGAAAIVPKGVWHTADVLEACRAVHVTAGKGTQHRPRS